MGKLYLLPKIYERLSTVPRRLVISNCGTEKASEFLDCHLKPEIQKGKWYIKDSGDCINEIKKLQNIPDGAILVTADVVGLALSQYSTKSLAYELSKKLWIMEKVRLYLLKTYLK